MRAFALAFVFLTAAYSLSQAPPAKRPIKHSDYEIWNSASSYTLSPDGNWLAYQQMPPEGDGLIIVKGLTNSQSYSIPQGSRSSGGATSALGSLSGSPQFTTDGKKVLFPLVPTKAEVDKARSAKKSIQTVLAVMDLANGNVVERIEKIRAFSVLEKSNSLILHREATKASPTAVGAVTGGSSLVPRTTAPQTPPSTTQPPRGPGRRPGFGTRGGAQPPNTPQAPEAPSGSDLVIRNLANGSEQTISDVVSFDATRDDAMLIMKRVSKTEKDNGLFALDIASKKLAPIFTGKGNTSRDTWDEKQQRLAFFHEEPAPEIKPNQPKPVVKPKVFIWKRGSQAPATELISDAPQGLKTGTMISTRGGIRFSDDGLKLALGTSEIPTTSSTPTQSPGTSTNRTESVDLDLWHWKDEQIQPMQKSPTSRSRTQTFSAVYFFDTKQFRQLSDEDLSVSVPDYGDWTLASNNKAYRYLTGYGPSLADYSAYNIRTGETKSLLKAFEGSILNSPKGTYRLIFDGKDWSSLSLPSGKMRNLTAKLTVKFFDEQFDQPMQARPYGITGWTQDEKFALVNDQYDIWKLALDGSSAENLTKIGRTSNISFAQIRFPDPDGVIQRGLDLSKPMLLNATNLKTYDSGFYQLDPGQSPRLLVMGGRDYGRPTKAKHADRYIFTISTFSDYPDYYTSDTTFREIRKVTDINPKKREFNWGKAELVHYKSLDGVELSGMLIKPEDFDAQKKYPMIVYIYERLSNGLHRFRLPSAGTSINPTYYASNGYLVFMPDIAYTVGSPGQSALKCVLPAIQAVVDKGCVDEKAIGIQGHSWGGYQIAYMVTQTNRFKAAASGAPVSNMVSAYGGIRWGTGLPRQFQYERTQSRIGGTLWNAPLKFIENSPIFMADRVETPLMILHNDQDDAVPWYQGIEYYLALRRLGKECYLFNYNGELHGLRKKSTQRDYTLRMQQFFDHHLKGAPMPDWMKSGIKFEDRDKEKDQWKKVFEKPKN